MLKTCITKCFKSAYLIFATLVIASGFVFSADAVLEASTMFPRKLSSDDQIFFKQSDFWDSGLTALFIVFAIVWAGFFLYAFYMSKKSQNLMREIEILKSKLEDPNSDN